MTAPTIERLRDTAASLPGRVGALRTASAAGWVIRAAVLLGAELRLRNWAADSSLWLDEIRISTNIHDRGYRDLTHPLGSDQAAPVGWLWSQRFDEHLFGPSDLSLRLFPLAVSLAGLVGFAALARRIAAASVGDRWAAGEWLAAMAVALFATSPYLIFYAVEVKQYGSDISVAVFVLLATVTLCGAQPPSSRRIIAWALGCAVLIWFSFPALAVAAVCGIILAARWLRTRADLVRFAVAGAILAASILGEYVVTLRSLAKNAELRSYWQGIGGYPTATGSPGDYAGWIIHAVPTVIRNPGGIGWPFLAVVLAVIGVGVLAWRRPVALAVVASPIVTGFVLASAHRYPLYQRTAVAIVPSLILLVATGALGTVTAVADIVKSRAVPRRTVVLTTAVTGSASAVLLVIAMTGSVRSGLDRFAHPDEVTAGREAVRYIGEHSQAGDLVVYESWARPTLGYYGKRYGVVGAGVMSPLDRCDTDELSALTGRRRVWFLFAHLGSNQPMDRNEVMLSRLEQQGRLVQSWAGPGHAGADLFDFGAVPVAPPSALPMWRPGTCLAVGLTRPTRRVN